MIAYPIGKVRRSLMAFRTEEITFGCHGRFCVFARPPRPQVHGPPTTQPLFEATLLQVHHLCFCRKKKPLRKFKMAKTLRATKRFPMSKRQPGLQLQDKVFAPHGPGLSIVPADDMGVVEHTQKTKTPMSSVK